VSAAYFIVLEKKIENLDQSMEGKMLARATEALEDIATLHKVRPLTGFTSIDPADAAAFLESEDPDMDKGKLPPLQQFTPDEGLLTVKALISHLETQPSAVRNSEGVLRDLRACDRILSAAKQHDLKWHFEVGV
jgi:hypothetical protein